MCSYNCFKGISKLGRCEILTLTNAVSVLLAEGLDDEDLDMLGNLLSAIGGVLSTFALVEEAQNKKKTPA